MNSKNVGLHSMFPWKGVGHLEGTTSTDGAGSVGSEAGDGVGDQPEMEMDACTPVFTVIVEAFLADQIALRARLALIGQGVPREGLETPPGAHQGASFVSGSEKPLG